MRKLTSLPYYLSSIPTILFKLNFWEVPLVALRKPILLRLKNGLNFYVWGLMDVWTVKEVVLDKQYEEVREIGKNDVVVDIGGGIGDFSVLASTRARKVFSCEVDSNRVALMKKNIKVNNVKNVIIVQRRVRSLKNLFRLLKIERCNFLKVDCEGCEYQIFADAQDSLKKIEHIVMEVHLFDKQMVDKFAKLREMLKSNGFSVVEKENPVHAYLKFLYASRK